MCAGRPALASAGDAALPGNEKKPPSGFGLRGAFLMQRGPVRHDHGQPRQDILDLYRSDGPRAGMTHSWTTGRRSRAGRESTSTS
jgi:hypothetical protein